MAVLYERNRQKNTYISRSTRFFFFPKLRNVQNNDLHMWMGVSKKARIKQNRQGDAARANGGLVMFKWKFSGELREEFKNGNMRLMTEFVQESGIFGTGRYYFFDY